jgi:hypothetical protein
MLLGEKVSGDQINVVNTSWLHTNHNTSNDEAGSRMHIINEATKMHITNEATKMHITNKVIINVKPAKPYVSTEILAHTNVEIGNIVGWKIHYANIGGSVAYNTYILEQGLPSWMAVSLTNHSINRHTHYNAGWITTAEGFRYNLGTLKPHAKGYITFFVKIVGTIPNNAMNVSNTVNLIFTTADNKIISENCTAQIPIIKSAIHTNHQTSRQTSNQTSRQTSHQEQLVNQTIQQQDIQKL